MKKLFAILILPLCISVGMMMRLHAAAQVQNAPPAAGWERIVFGNERTDIPAVIKTYPILKGTIGEVQRLDKAGSSGTPDALRVRIAVTRSQTRNVSLLFLYIDDRNWCGSHGCKMSIYADDGTGYKEAGDIIAFPLVYLSTGGSQVSLLFCGSLQGGGKWNLKNNAFVFVGLSTCPAITPHS